MSTIDYTIPFGEGNEKLGRLGGLGKKRTTQVKATFKVE